MIKTFLYIVVIASLPSGLLLRAEPSPSSSKKKSTKHTSTAPAKTVATTPVVSGWSLNNGVWVHIDGYKLVNGQVVRSSAQTHKPAPKPPTPAEMQVATKKKVAPKTPAEIAAEKAAERERNLAPRPAPQTGTHL